MRRLVSVALPLAFLSLSAIPILAQERSAEMDALEWMVGEWTFDTLPDGSGATSVCEWFGNAFLKCEESHTDASGELVGSVLSVYQFEAEGRVYRLSHFNSVGIDVVFSGTVQDDTWTWIGEIPGVAKYRGTTLLETRDAYTIKTETLEDGEWVSHGEGRWTRIR